MLTEKKDMVFTMRKIVKRVAIASAFVTFVQIFVIASIMETPGFWTAASTISAIIGVISGTIAAVCAWLLDT